MRDIPHRRKDAAAVAAAIGLLTPALCFAVDIDSPAYRNGKLVGIALAAVLLVLLVRKMFGNRLGLAAAVIAAVGWGAFFSTGGKTRQLDKTVVEAFIQQGMKASVERDVKTLCSHYAEDVRITMITVRFSGSETVSYGKADWCEQLKRAYAALPRGVSIDTRATMVSLDVTPDGQHAEVSLDLLESMTIGGQSVRMKTSQQASMALVNGAPRYTSVRARVVGGQ